MANSRHFRTAKESDWSIRSTCKPQELIVVEQPGMYIQYDDLYQMWDIHTGTGSIQPYNLWCSIDCQRGCLRQDCSFVVHCYGGFQSALEYLYSWQEDTTPQIRYVNNYTSDLFNFSSTRVFMVRFLLMYISVFERSSWVHRPWQYGSTNG